ncbi:hypothetical protein BDF14DRAFT_1880618 [Spinellus fusiger]|nr:hypothetical protein BDF14DRAFT_1880618 [Spinellus fusiger]
MDAFQRRFNQTALDSGLVPDDLVKVSHDISSYLYYISFVCSLAVIGGYFVIAKYSPQHNRTSLRLLVYDSVAHIILGITALCRNTIVGSHVDCIFIMIPFIFFNTLTILLTTCMAINLHVVYVHSAPNVKRLEHYYLFTSCVVSLLTAVAPLFTEGTNYGFNRGLNSCWFVADTVQKSILWSVLDTFVLMNLCIIYCIVAIILVLIKIRREEKKVNAHVEYTEQVSGERKPFNHLFFRPRQHIGTVAQATRSQCLLGTHFKPRPHERLEVSYVVKTVSRIIWYPIVLIATRVWVLFNTGYIMHTGKVNALFVFMTYISLPTQAFHIAVHKWWIKRRNKRDLKEDESITSTEMCANLYHLKSTLISKDTTLPKEPPKIHSLQRPLGNDNRTLSNAAMSYNDANPYSSDANIYSHSNSDYVKSQTECRAAYM